MRASTKLRWTARLLGMFSGGLLLAFAFGGRESLRLTLGQAIAFLLFPVGLIVGLVIAWWRDLVGGLTAIVSVALLYAYVLVGSGKWLGPYFLLFATPGFLHVATAASERRENRVGQTSRLANPANPPAPPVESAINGQP